MALFSCLLLKINVLYIGMECDTMHLPDYIEARTRDKREYKRLDYTIPNELKGKYKG